MEWTNAIPWILSALLLILNFLTFLRNGKKEKKNEWKDEAGKLDELKESNIVFSMKMDQLCSNTQEIRVDIKTMNKDLYAMESRISAIERDNKTLFNIVNELKKGGVK